MLKKDPRLSFSDWLVHGVFNMQFRAGRALRAQVNIHPMNKAPFWKDRENERKQIWTQLPFSLQRQSSWMVGKKKQDLITAPSPWWEDLHICEETKFFLPGGNTNLRKNYGKKAHVGLWQSYRSILLLSHLRSGVLHTKIRWNKVPRPKQ